MQSIRIRNRFLLRSLCVGAPLAVVLAAAVPLSLAHTEDEFEQKIDGDNGDNVLVGGDERDHIRGLGGDDTIDGKDGHDHLVGGDGNDTIQGGDDGDDIKGDDGDDTIDGGDGDDVIHGGFGNDTIDGGDGNDDINGSQHNDIINGGGGNDTIASGEGGGVVHGHAGNDTITTHRGNDLVDAGSGNDTIHVGPDNCFIITGPGRDSVHFAAASLNGTDHDNPDAGKTRIADLGRGDTINLAGVSAGQITLEETAMPDNKGGALAGCTFTRVLVDGDEQFVILHLTPRDLVVANGRGPAASATIALKPDANDPASPVGPVMNTPPQREPAGGGRDRLPTVPGSDRGGRGR